MSWPARWPVRPSLRLAHVCNTLYLLRAPPCPPASWPPRILRYFEPVLLSSARSASLRSHRGCLARALGSASLPSSLSALFARFFYLCDTLYLFCSVPCPLVVVLSHCRAAMTVRTRPIRRVRDIDAASRPRSDPSKINTSSSLFCPLAFTSSTIHCTHRDHGQPAAHRPCASFILQLAGRPVFTFYTTFLAVHLFSVGRRARCLGRHRTVPRRMLGSTLAALLHACGTIRPAAHDASSSLPFFLITSSARTTAGVLA